MNKWKFPDAIVVEDEGGYRCSCWWKNGGRGIEVECAHVREVEAGEGSKPTRDINALATPDDPPLPTWLVDLAPHQWQAVEEVIALFESGVRIVWLDAPTGAGKTAIGEAVRRIMRKKGIAKTALYVCSDRGLQDQFVADFPYAKVLKGRRNYSTLLNAEATAADCTSRGKDSKCSWCSDENACPYRVAKRTAVMSPLAVLNTAYLLAEGSGESVFSGRGLVIADECDVLENALMGFVEFRVTDAMLRKFKLIAPKKGSHHPTLVKWIDEELQPAVDNALNKARGVSSLFGDDIKQTREIKQLESLKRDITGVLARVEGEGQWVRDNDAGPLVLRPVEVAPFGEDVLWRHGKHWLCMSATVISADQMARSLGVQGGEGEVGGWGVVTVPAVFPVENRPVFMSPVANMVRAEQDTAWPQMVDGIRAVLERHGPDERVLVHAVSYALAQAITEGLKKVTSRRIITYRNANNRVRALDLYTRTPGAVLVAPSMERGVDLKDDLCRVVIVAKVPYPYLGDPQVSRRMKLPDGGEWYAVQVVRNLVQMTGRGVRHKNDHAATYILDAQFHTNTYQRARYLFPRWWLESIEFLPVPQLLRGHAA